MPYLNIRVISQPKVPHMSSKSATLPIHSLAALGALCMPLLAQEQPAPAQPGGKLPNPVSIKLVKVADE